MLTGGYTVYGLPKNVRVVPVIFELMKVRRFVVIIIIRFI